MISEQSNIIAFVNAVKDLDREEIVRAATLERRAAIDRKDKDKYSGQKSTQYGLDLGELLYMLNYDNPPKVEPTLSYFRPIVEALVEKGQMSPGLLAAFEQAI
jgi:hypothetical protein